MATILIVEDNEMNRDMLSRRLQRRGFEVTTAVDGREGVDKALREIDGWEATRLLKADDATQHIPIIALTAHAMPEDREKALAAGCDEYDSKPIDINRLLEKIQHLCGTQGT
jgi:two-component system cell cycle response regulator DivK